MEEHFNQEGGFMVRDGVAQVRGMKALCTKQVCFMTSDAVFLKQTLYSISMSNDCIRVKYAVKPREGVYIGLVLFTNESATGDMWARYESHPKTWVTVRDDAFCDAYRSSIRNYL